MFSPVFNQDLRFLQAVEDFSVQQLIPEAAVDALDKPILHRGSRCDVVPIDAAVLLPLTLLLREPLL